MQIVQQREHRKADKNQLMIPDLKLQVILTQFSQPKFFMQVSASYVLLRLSIYKFGCTTSFNIQYNILLMSFL